MNLHSKFHPNWTMVKWSKIGGNFEKKNKNLQSAMKFHPNRTMGKGSKIGGRLGNVTNQLTDVEKPSYTHKWLSLRLGSFFSKRNLDTGFEISSVDIPEISPHTKCEQPRVAGKHLMRLAKNGMAAVTYRATLLRGPPSFW